MRDGNTKKPELDFQEPTKQDISYLLAAIQKIEQYEQSRPSSDNTSELSNPPTKHRRRLTEVLDSLAGLGVSEITHEALATGLRVNDQRKSLELFVSSNANVANHTTGHLKEIWKFMKQLSDRYSLLHSAADQEESPQTKPDDPEFFRIYNEFARECFGFSFSRIRHKVNSKFGKLMAIDIRGLSHGHPFLEVRDSIANIEYLYTREDRPSHGKPRHGDIDGWILFYMFLRQVKQKAAYFFAQGGFRGADRIRTCAFLGVERYICKIGSFANSFEVLVKAALSPKCRQLFTYNITVHPLTEWSTKLEKVPNTPEDWGKILEKAVVYTNRQQSYEDRKEEFHVLDMPVVTEDTAHMAREAIGRTIMVHCDIKMLVTLQRSSDDAPNLPKPCTYIGVSKLPCNGCECFFRAFNLANNSGWVTKGGHGKSYYPWMLPEPFPKHDLVRRYTYSIMADNWVHSYRGYQVRRTALEPDSTDRPSRSAEVDPEEERLADRFAEMVEMVRREQSS